MFLCWEIRYFKNVFVQMTKGHMIEIMQQARKQEAMRHLL